MHSEHKFVGCFIEMIMGLWLRQKISSEVLLALPLLERKVRGREILSLAVSIEKGVSIVFLMKHIDLLMCCIHN